MLDLWFNFCMVANTQSNRTDEVESKEENQPREANSTRANGIKSMRIPKIPDNQQNPLIAELLEIIHLQSEQIQALKDEIAILKGQKPKPKITPSNLGKSPQSGDNGEGDGGKRPGSEKKSKTADLVINETLIVKADNVPAGSRFKGFENFTVQSIVFKSHNILFRLERWETPEGDEILAKVPDKDAVGHFGTPLICYILYQYYQAQVTQPLIFEQLKEIGVDISTGQVNRIITEGKDRFHAEKAEILRVGLKISSCVNVDDTSAPHKGKNGYCTHIGNEFFAWFESTESKSRLNFLKLLRCENTDYVLNDEALNYMVALKLPRAMIELLSSLENKSFSSEAEWNTALQSFSFSDERHIRIATEGALLGSVFEHGINPMLIILSDDAGQFCLLLHALCWIHAERTIKKLVGFNDEQRKALEEIREQIWNYYSDLKAYKESPDDEKKIKLSARFDEIFLAQTCYKTLNQALKRIYNNKAELLLVLDYPNIPLHNNLSEGDIREYVKRRKISGSTRSDLGRKCRDTFASLKKTCRKLAISFWDFLMDRISGKNTIPWLSEVMFQQMAETPNTS